MQLAFCLFKYFPFGGMQRDFMRIAVACQRRGHAIRVYVLSWEGEVPAGFEVVIVPVRALTNAARYEKYVEWVAEDLRARPAGRIVGFNKMPGLDVYFAADSCYEEKVATQRNALYRYSGRYRHFSRFERAVFGHGARTRILMISSLQQPLFERHHGTEPERFHLLPPGIARDRRKPSDAPAIREGFRAEFGLAPSDLLLLQIGSGFKTKGLDRSLRALASLPAPLRERTRLFAIGQDDPRVFKAMAAGLGLADRVRFFSGRDDIPRFLLGGDLLVHPAYNENTGTVLLEAIVAGLPVLASEVCGYAHYVTDAGAGRLLVEPFAQDAMNTMLADALTRPELRAAWQRNGLVWAETADIYDNAERAADVILGDVL